MKPLKPSHADETLIPSKLGVVGKVSSDELRGSLAPGHEHCLKVRPDGTMLDGHHRVYVLRSRGLDVDALPREILEAGGGDGKV